MVTTRSNSKTAPGPRSRPRPDLAAHPSEEELITSFLRPRVVSGGGDGRDGHGPRAPSFIHDADVYSAGPGALTRRLAPAVASNGDCAWYFFSAVRAKTRDGQRKARTVDTVEGCWHSEAGAKPVVVEEGAGRILVGHRQGFSFVTKVDGRRVRSGWLMVELSLDGAGADDVVLCKIYFSPRARASSASSGRSKRKADYDDSNPADSASRRRRGPPTEAEAGTPTPNTNAEEEDNTQSRGGLAADDNSTVTDDPDALWTDDSIFSWWMRNKDWLMEHFNIVDRPDEEIQKTYKLDEYLLLLEHHYTDFGCGHSPVLNS